MAKREIIVESNKLNPSAILNLFKVALYGIDTMYFYAGTAFDLDPIIFNGIAYAPVPLEMEEFEIDGRGRLPRPKITISNVQGIISNIILSQRDLVGAVVTRTRVFYKYIDDVNFPNGVNPWGVADAEAAFSEEVYYINRKLLENKEIVQFELTTPWEVDNEKLPKRTIFALICGFQYRELSLVNDTGYIYYADMVNAIIRSINLATKQTSTIAGTSPTDTDLTLVDGVGDQANFKYTIWGEVKVRGILCNVPQDATFLWVFNRNRFRKVFFNGVVQTIIGQAQGDGFISYTDGDASVAEFCTFSYDGFGAENSGEYSSRRIFFSQYIYPAIRVMTPVNGSARIDTIAGSAEGSTGYVDAIGTSARFNNPRGTCVKGNGSSCYIFVADSQNHCIRVIRGSNYSVTTLCGTNIQGNSNGTGSTARFAYPSRVTYCEKYNCLYVLDQYGWNKVIINFSNPAAPIGTVTGLPTIYSDMHLYDAGPTLGLVAVRDNNSSIGTCLLQLNENLETIQLIAGDYTINGWTDGIGPAARFGGINSDS